jgi:hypothetical protein
MNPTQTLKIIDSSAVDHGCELKYTYSKADKAIIDSIQMHIDDRSKSLLDHLGMLDATPRQKREAYINDQTLIRLNKMLVDIMSKITPTKMNYFTMIKVKIL